MALVMICQALLAVTKSIFSRSVGNGGKRTPSLVMLGRDCEETRGEVTRGEGWRRGEGEEERRGEEKG